MSLGFNPTPAVGELHTAGTKTWRWNGAGWESATLKNTFMQAIAAQPWVETLITSYPSAVTGAHSGTLLNYI